VPADLTGTRVYHQHTGEFQTQLGPVFTNLLLADEINRAPAKVQSALLEVMQEHQVTIGRGRRRPAHRRGGRALAVVEPHPAQARDTVAAGSAHLRLNDIAPGDG